MVEPKYRPVLTGKQIDTLLDLCKSVATLTPEVMSCIATLSPFQAKIQHRAITPAYTTSALPKQSIEQKLGLAPVPQSLSPLVKRKQAYDRLVSSHGRGMSVDELELAHQFRYDNGLMGADEMVIFESGQHNPHAFLTSAGQPLIDTDSPLLDSPSITPDDLSGS